MTEENKTSSEKWYSVYVWAPEGAKPAVVQHHIVDFSKAERVAGKAAIDYRGDAYILTTTHVVRAPIPALEIEEIK